MPTIKKELSIITHCLEEHKAEDITAIDISESSPFASYAVIATCPNPRALGAMQDHLEEALLQNDIAISAKEGIPDSGWVIIQGEEVIVHMMLAGHRRMLDLETLLAQLNERNSVKD